MTTINEPRQSIQARKVTQDVERLECLPRHFGRYMLRVEDAVFTFMQLLSEGYSGGYWTYYELSNGGFFMAPPEGPWKIAVEGNGFSGELSTEATGVVVCLFALSHLSFRIQDDAIGDHFYALREYALEHPEGQKILQAID